MCWTIFVPGKHANIYFAVRGSNGVYSSKCHRILVERTGGENAFGTSKMMGDIICVN